jgi:hypothetical protein
MEFRKISLSLSSNAVPVPLCRYSAIPSFS